MTADVVLPIPLPQTVSDIFPTMEFDRLSLLLRRRCQAARHREHIRRDSLKPVGEGYTRSFKCA